MIKDELKFSSKILLSKKRIVTFVKLDVPEDKIEDNDKTQGKKKLSDDYKIYLHTFGIPHLKGWCVKVVLVQSKNPKIL